MKIKYLIVLVLFYITPIHAIPLSELKLANSTSFNWLLWKIYDIELLTQSGRYEGQSKSLALAITYARDIDSSDLISSTKDEWTRLKIQWKDQWITALEVIWPDVSDGDELILHVDEQLVSHFYFNGQLIGKIVEPEFSIAFQSIWLSEDSRNRDLTKN